MTHTKLSYQSHGPKKIVIFLNFFFVHFFSPSRFFLCVCVFFFKSKHVSELLTVPDFPGLLRFHIINCDRTPPYLDTLLMDQKTWTKKTNKKWLRQERRALKNDPGWIDPEMQWLRRRQPPLVHKCQICYSKKKLVSNYRRTHPCCRI